MDYTSLFYEDNKEQFSDNIAGFVDFCNNIRNVFGGDDGSFHWPEHISQLYQGTRNNGAISKAQYYRIRKYVFALYDWLEEKEYIPHEINEMAKGLSFNDILANTELKSSYFCDLDSALGFIKQAGNIYGLDRDQMIQYSAIVILAWYGVESDDIVNIKKSDLDKTKCEVNVAGKVIQIPKSYFNTLYSFSELSTYYGFPGGLMLYFKDSEYLFRTSRQTKLTKGNLRSMLAHFNASVGKLGKKILYNEIKMNGMLYRVHQMVEAGASINVAIIEAVQCDRFQASGYKKLYLKWRDEFYKER